MIRWPVHQNETPLGVVAALEYQSTDEEESFLPFAHLKTFLPKAKK
jgi:hypothetical protein